MTVAEMLVGNLAVVAVLMLGVWLLSIPLRNVGIVDIFWGLGFVVLAWTSAGAAEFPGPRSWLLPWLASGWGLRLAVHLAWRSLGRPEDHRYRAIRERWGPRFWWTSLGIVFGLQGLIMWLISLPLQFGPRSATPLAALDLLGVALWAVGLTFETLGDWQLARFQAVPANRGTVLDRGLWRYTRHPNYFGDFLVWWGFFLIAWSGGAAAWTVGSPVLMSVLLLRVSGVALLEKDIEQRRPAYREYMRRTSAFFPWPPRRGSAS